MEEQINRRHPDRRIKSPCNQPAITALPHAQPQCIPNTAWRGASIPLRGRPCDMFCTGSLLQCSRSMPLHGRPSPPSHLHHACAAPPEYCPPSTRLHHPPAPCPPLPTLPPSPARERVPRPKGASCHLFAPPPHSLALPPTRSSPLPRSPPAPPGGLPSVIASSSRWLAPRAVGVSHLLWVPSV